MPDLDWVKDYLELCFYAFIPTLACIVILYSLVVVININPLLGWPVVLVVGGSIFYPLYRVLRKREKRRTEEIMEGEDNKRFLTPEESRDIIEHLFPEKDNKED
jgi:hypothetical protein